MRIGDMNRDNYASFQNIINNMKPKGASGKEEDTSMYIGKFEHRFQPTNIKFVQPNWGTDVLTKTDKPAMSDEEFEEAIKEIARDHANIPAGKKVDMTKYYALCKQYISTVSPDRQSIYADSMKQTGGKMNAAKSFWDKSSQLSMIYNSTAGVWGTVFTDAESAKAVQFHSIYVDEIKKVQAAAKGGGQAAAQNTSIDVKA